MRQRKIGSDVVIWGRVEWDETGLDGIVQSQVKRNGVQLSTMYYLMFKNNKLNF